MEAVSTRVRPRVAPGVGVVGRDDDGWNAVTLVSGLGTRDKIVEQAGRRPSQVERRLFSAAGMERR
jgi:hypothetical protein